MAQIILDMGSGNTCKNDFQYAKRMIDAVAAIDTHKHEVIFKWQLFWDEPPNIPLDQVLFSRAYLYAKYLGYKTTSSVFDKESLAFLLTYDVPFVKIACRPRIYWLTGEIPRKIPIILSVETGGALANFPGLGSTTLMFCVPKYPAALTDYSPGRDVYSDHTVGLQLWYEQEPSIWEKHFILEDDPTNPDAAGHAIKPDLLKEIL